MPLITLLLAILCGTAIMSSRDNIHTALDYLKTDKRVETANAIENLRRNVKKRLQYIKLTNSPIDVPVHNYTYNINHYGMTFIASTHHKNTTNASQHGRWNKIRHR
jgi:hypothetical protein